MKKILFLSLFFFANSFAMKDDKNHPDVGTCILAQDFVQLEEATVASVETALSQGGNRLVVVDNGGVFPIGCLVSVDDGCEPVVSIYMPSCYENPDGEMKCSIHDIRHYAS